MMGLSPGDLSLSGYLESLAAWNEAHDPDAAKDPGEVTITADMDRLKRFHRAHRTVQ